MFFFKTIIEELKTAKDQTIKLLNIELDFFRADHARLLTEIELQRQRLTKERDAALMECERLRLACFPLTSAAGANYVKNQKQTTETKLSATQAPFLNRPRRLSWQEVQDNWAAQQEKELEELRQQKEKVNSEGH